MMKQIWLASCLTALSLFATTVSSETVVPEKGQNLNVTIYNADRALIRDRRFVALSQGPQTISFAGVSDRLIPESALVEAADTRVLEQNFNYDVLSYDSLMAKSVGQSVMLEKTNPATGLVTTREATLLSYNNGQGVFKVGDFIEANDSGRVLFDKIPQNLRAKPTLSLRLDTPKNAEREVTLSYLSAGLSWEANYVGALSADDTRLRLNGFVTLTNDTGTPFHAAKVALVAGDVHLVNPFPAAPRFRVKTALMNTMDAAGSIAPESVGDYHLYTLPGQTDILSRQTKQVAFLTVKEIGVSKTYEFSDPFSRGTEVKGLKPEIFFSFVNDKTVDQPLPKGVVRLYKENKAGEALFVGEDRLNHTARGQTVRLNVGQAFDISADAVEKSRVKLSKNAWESAYEMTIKNGADTPAVVTLAQTFGKNFKIISESAPSTARSATTRVWEVTVPAEGEARFTVTVQVNNE